MRCLQSEKADKRTDNYAPQRADSQNRRSRRLIDEGLLDSALNAPFQGFGDTDNFSVHTAKRSETGLRLICNHAFVDGNKRIGAHAMLVFLSINGIELEYTQRELSDMVLNMASGTLQFEDMVKWIIKHQA